MIIASDQDYKCPYVTSLYCVRNDYLYQTMELYRYMDKVR
jgi:hypothetical protein